VGDACIVHISINTRFHLIGWGGGEGDTAQYKKIYKHPGADQIPAEIIQVGGKRVLQ
jgi:hypothetical protein